MAFRANIGVLPQPFRWIAPGAWAVLAAAAVWLRSRSSARLGISPLSADWLHDMERRSTRNRDL